MTFQPTLPLRGATRQQSTMPPSGAFQPTLPLRGATHARTRCTRRRSSFNPRSPCGERPDPARVALQVPDVSTHAPLAGSDVQVVDGAARRNLVSTHAPLAGSDCSAASCSQRPTSFNPRSPCGERPNLWFWQIALHTVSTHAPLAGSDGVGQKLVGGEHVSTHAPLAGSDLDGGQGRGDYGVSTHAPLAGSD